MISQLVKITAILFALGAALPAFAFGDDVGMTFKPERNKVVRVLARIVDHYDSDEEQAVLVEPRDRANNSKLAGLIETLKEDGREIEGTFRIKGKPLHHVMYLFDKDRMQLKVRVNNVNYIISQLRFLDIED